MTVGSRRRAYRLGRHAETLCAWYLRLCGYRIVARDYRTPVGEIDIVARRGRVLAVVEVKARDSFAEAVEAITPSQRARITRAARLFLASRPGLTDLAVRFDVLVITPWRLPVHLIDAWRDEPDTAKYSGPARRMNRR